MLSFNLGKTAVFGNFYSIFFSSVFFLDSMDYALSLLSMKIKLCLLIILNRQITFIYKIQTGLKIGCNWSKLRTIVAFKHIKRWYVFLIVSLNGLWRPPFYTDCACLRLSKAVWPVLSQEDAESLTHVYCLLPSLDYCNL